MRPQERVRILDHARFPPYDPSWTKWGGHIAPYSFVSIPGFAKPHKDGGAGLSMDEALDKLEMEQGILSLITEIVEKEGWDVDLRRGEQLEGELGR